MMFFCNVGIAFLFDYFGGLNETLAFDFGRKRILLGKSGFLMQEMKAVSTMLTIFGSI